MSTTERRRYTLAATLVALLLIGGTLGITTVSAASDLDPHEPSHTGNTTESGEPRIIELYPSPVAHGNVGEFVTIEFPTETEPNGWTLHDDGRQTAHLPSDALEGTVALSHEPAETRQHTDHDVYPLDGHIQFAEDGETVTLKRNGSVVDSVTYDRAAEAELWERTEDGTGSWSPIEATDIAPATTKNTDATAFVLPDAPEASVELIERADERIMLAAYTYSDARVTDALIAAHERGVDTRVAVEASPVGGTGERSVDQLDELTAAGVDVVAFGGDHARYRFHHGKFAVADDEALVMTENWKPSGAGGQANRGWGVVTHDAETANAIADVFEADLDASDSLQWDEYGETVDPVEEPKTEGRYPAEFDSSRLAVEETTVLTAPDNAEPEIRREIEDADESILLTQVSIGGHDDPLLQEAIEAAHRGVELRILLSSAWYTDDENAELQEWLNELADTEDIDIEVQVADPGDRYERLHTKGVIIDDETVILGSINWNTHSLRENRELALVLEGDEVAEYYTRVFNSDWAGIVWRFPVGLGAVLVAGTTGAVIIAHRRVEFA
ncbi:phospholipase D-like domain-containing protein [Natranaeroarchaeum sulfidigenes]|uniref:Phosphatidylserine/phosphatidylglycerophosphate/ cardiolipin synthase or related enzyme n=1 Tax=Natranaeroarchaeum sulfidigenes TaxID=2784880 RepID=A0A897MLR6_9EURY|nr:phospholipase D-like domain-containing protein [Natranaeroarchaeum sulfidigenes]QSG03140.1 Phosphatidylserine/phosphatidylglycerophosphate/ cardiolipin synthase or related enzyme [Natranaeroarchaeum sulfidigenes]